MPWTAHYGILKRKLPANVPGNWQRFGLFLKSRHSFTISLDTPEKMGEAAKANARLPILKLKLGGDDPDLARIEAVRGVAPTARLLIDANESWSPEHYQKIVPL
jgi:L-alanine-DL-glutamate epimerase-like enolase superfamily enzyme